MYNSSHTALSRGSGRIEDACGESPAASLLWLRSLVEVQIIRSLFVHHSFIIRSYSCIDFGSKKGSGGVSGGVPGLSWRVLGGSRGPLGGVLGRPGAISVKTFWL